MGGGEYEEIRGNKSQSLFRGAKVGIFPSPITSIEGERSEFVQVPKPLQRGRAWNFPKSQNSYRDGGVSSEFFQVPKPI
mgnify:CR=1 FL=1